MLLIEHGGFHPVTVRTARLFEKNQHPLLAVLPRKTEFLLEVAEGLVKEVLPRITGRGGTRQ